MMITSQMKLHIQETRQTHQNNDDNETIPGCHSYLQSKFNCVVHVMQVELQREGSSNLSPNRCIDDKESNNAEILSLLKYKSAAVLHNSIHRKVTEELENGRFEESIDSSASNRSNFSDNHDTYTLNLSNEFCCSVDSPEAANESIQNSEYNKKELDDTSYLQSADKNND